AVGCEGQQLTYAQVDRRSNRLARLLIERGVGPESLVGVLLDRSAELVIALLAVLKAGGAYVPVDPDYPTGRVRGMLADAEPVVVLTTAAVAQSPSVAGVAGPGGARGAGW